MRNIRSAVGWQRTQVTREGFLEEVGLNGALKSSFVGSDLIQDTAMAREEQSLCLLPTLEEVGGDENLRATHSSTDPTASREGAARALLGHFPAL